MFNGVTGCVRRSRGPDRVAAGCWTETADQPRGTRRTRRLRLQRCEEPNDTAGPRGLENDDTSRTQDG
ncbi:hypothetical protein VZT92_006989 [Zoarces viviparus]